MNSLRPKVPELCVQADVESLNSHLKVTPTNPLLLTAAVGEICVRNCGQLILQRLCGRPIWDKIPAESIQCLPGFNEA